MKTIAMFVELVRSWFAARKESRQNQYAADAYIAVTSKDPRKPQSRRYR